MTDSRYPRTAARCCSWILQRFLSEKGTLWPYVRTVAEEVRLLDNLRTVYARSRGDQTGGDLSVHRRIVGGSPTTMPSGIVRISGGWAAKPT